MFFFSFLLLAETQYDGMGWKFDDDDDFFFVCIKINLPKPALFLPSLEVPSLPSFF
jgi:hypothetical protein